MNLLRILSVALAGFLSPPVMADVYKCVDAAGHLTYTNDKPAPGQKGCTLLSRDQPAGPVQQSRKRSATPTPANFPRVDSDTQKGRDNDRRKILEQELGTEQQLLEAARKALIEGEAAKNNDPREYQKYIDRMQSLRDSVKQHETNVDKLKTELAKMR